MASRTNFLPLSNVCNKCKKAVKSFRSDQVVLWRPTWRETESLKPVWSGFRTAWNFLRFTCQVSGQVWPPLNTSEKRRLSYVDSILPLGLTCSLDLSKTWLVPMDISCKQNVNLNENEKNVPLVWILPWSTQSSLNQWKMTKLNTSFIVGLKGINVGSRNISTTRPDFH